MDKIIEFTSKTVVLSVNDIDTDQIIPARFLTVTTKDGLGDGLFSDWRFDESGNKIEDFPILTRAGRQTEEVVMVRDALKQSIDNNYEAFELSGIPADNYNSWQQRIRTQAKKLGINVEVRFSAEKETLAFRAKAPKTTGKPEKDSK